MQKKSRSLNAKSTASLPRHGDPEGLLRRDQGAVPQGLLLHSAGFDTDGGVFRIFDVWQTREDGERFMTDRLEPIGHRERRGLRAAGARGLVRAARHDERVSASRDRGYRSSNSQV